MMNDAMKNLLLFLIAVQSLINVNWAVEIVIMIPIAQETLFAELIIVKEILKQTELNGIGIMTVVWVRDLSSIFWQSVSKISLMFIRLIINV